MASMKPTLPTTVLCFLLLALGASMLLWPPRRVASAATESQPTYYTVQPGDSLASIAAKLYHNQALWLEIYRLNRTLVQHANTLQPGWRLQLPALPTVSPRPQAAASGSPPAPPTAAKKVRLVTGPDFPPFIGEALPEQGMLTEIVRTAFTTAGYDVEITSREWSESLKATQEGRFAGAFPYAQGAGDNNAFLASKPLERVLIRAFVRQAQAITFETLEDLRGRTICHQEGAAIPDLTPLAARQLMTLHTPATLDTCFHLLMQQKVDVVAVSELSGQSMLQRMGLTDSVCVLEKAIAINTLHLLLPTGQVQSRPLLEAFEQAMRNMAHAGQLQDITARHLRQYYNTLSTSPTPCLPTKTQPAEVSESSPAPRQQSGEFLTLVPPKRLPAQLELVSIAVTDRPAIDGQANERLWELAPTITTLDYSSQRPITLKSVHTADEIFFLVTFPDQAPSMTHRSWQWDAKEKVYKPMGDREDAFVFKWSLDGPEVNLAIRRAAEPHRADIWYWKARRTNPVGYADDKIDLLQLEPAKDAIEVASSTHGKLYFRRLGDAGEPAYEDRLISAYQGDIVPRSYPRTPQGSRADVRAKGVWQRGTWTIEFGRKLHTGHDDDLALQLGGVYLFGVSCYEIVYGTVDPELTQPLFYTGDIFDRLLLKIARGNTG